MSFATRTIAALALLAAGTLSAQAQVQSAEAGTIAQTASTPSTLTRAEVRDAVIAARANGTLIQHRGDELRVSVTHGSQAVASRTANTKATTTVADGGQTLHLQQGSVQ
ncbi:hypothetical protein SDC9_77308 [bioreactor metagenome]|uniref:DUF4148 domain-containing protein n=1 Tax=bioreactor metagenome TaxID=1076179 RepID=A0A644YS07_9ZZZZ